MRGTFRISPMHPSKSEDQRAIAVTSSSATMASSNRSNDDEMEVVQVTEAVPILPPRPDAIVTLLTTDDFLPGAQTLLYSVKKTLSTDILYPPELVVLVTPNVSQATRDELLPTFCHRFIEVQPLSFPDESDTPVVPTHVPSLDLQGVLTKLHIFRLENYGALVFLDADCLVVKDVSSLLDLCKVYTESDSLVAAAPDIFPPDKFNAGVLVIRPSERVFADMMEQRGKLGTYDGGDTGFLNAYFSDWYKHMPPISRLSFGYNAQRFLYKSTYEKQPNYWDVAVAPDLHVIHYSSSPKPWQVAMVEPPSEVTESDFLNDQDKDKLRKTTRGSELEALWRKQYQRSRNYSAKALKARQQQEKQQQEASQRKSAPPPPPPSKSSPSKSQQQQVHKQVSKRYKQLRKEGKPPAEAMELARAEYGLDQADHVSAGTQVANMFGMGSLM